jgi:hypothetical protein
MACRIIAHHGQKFGLELRGWLEVLGSLEDTKAARPAARAATGERNGCPSLVAKIEQAAAFRGVHLER